MRGMLSSMGVCFLIWVVADLTVQARDLLAKNLAQETIRQRDEMFRQLEEKWVHDSL